MGSDGQDVVVPIPRGERAASVRSVRQLLDIRIRGRCFIKQCGLLLEAVLRFGSSDPLSRFYALSLDEVAGMLTADTRFRLSMAHWKSAWISTAAIRNDVYVPRYYDPTIEDELVALSKSCTLKSVRELAEEGLLSISTGDEPGKMAYGTGDIPFIRTSDFANWELKHDPKQSVSEQIYEIYRAKQDVRPYDILLVRDGTYLVGSSTILLPEDAQCVYCGGLYKIRAQGDLDPFLMFGLLNSYIVKRQIRARQFTRDVIDTLGRRLFEILVPIPKLSDVREDLGLNIRRVVEQRVAARGGIQRLARTFYAT